MLQLILHQTEMTTIFGNSKSLLNILKLSNQMGEDAVSHVKRIVCFEDPSEELKF